MPEMKDAKVLIVDDSITVREIMKRQLSDMGILETEYAKTGTEALEMYRSFQPDLVFLDINMPEMNGVEVLSQLMEIDPKANVVMLSSLGTKEKISESLEKGAKNFLMKPVADDNLKRIVTELVS